jgi:hypothetical protein
VSPPKTIAIVYVGPLRAYVEDGLDDDSKTPAPVVEIVDTGQVATYGVAIDVDATVAGRPPKLLTPAVEAKGEPGTPGYEPAVAEVWDPGEGLLAQADNWQLATTKSKEPTDG